MSASQLKIVPHSEHVEDVSASEFGNANLAILHDEALMVAEGEEKMTGQYYHCKERRPKLTSTPLTARSFHLPPRLRCRSLWPALWLCVVLIDFYERDS